MDPDSILSHVAFTTSGSLVDCVDKKVIVVLRDGRKLIGVLRSYDQFANLVLQDAVERVFVGNRYGDIPCGLFLVRGENVVLLGEIDLDQEDEIPPQISSPLPPGASTDPSSIAQLRAAHAAEDKAKKAIEARKAKFLRSQKGFCEEGQEGDGY